eukprot:XP_011665966.1 PREDICTED: uncharacterized protein LOC105439089 [Strongylocentrotus purpuratus]
MAKKTEEGKAPSSSENLTCPLCLDIFDEATILTSCGHTFCRKCLENYDLSHQDLDHMICPLCRNITKLSANRVDDFLTNVTVNGLVDDYHAKCGGVDAALEIHEQSHFEGHEIVSLQDIINRKVSVGHDSENCCIHKQENNDMFCEDCKVLVCLKCVIVGHKNHKIKNQADFEQELRLKVNELVQRCATKKSELEKNIQNVEVQRHEVYTAVQRLLDDVDQTYSIKAKKLEDNHRNLIERINAIKRSFDDDLNVLKSNDRTRIKSICSSIALVSNDRLGGLETDSLSAHTLLCEELDAMLKKATDHTSAAAITKKAQERRFKPAYDTHLDLGSISESTTDHTSTAAITKKAQERRFKPAYDTHLDLGSISESTTDYTSAAAIAKKAHEKTFKPAYATHLGIGSISESVPKLQVIQCVVLRGTMWGMTPYSDDSVAIGYGDTHGIDIIDSAGNQEQYANIPSNMKCYDLVFQNYRSLCISTGAIEAHIYSPNGSRKSTIHVKRNSYIRLNRSQSDEILIANNAMRVYIYDPTGSILKHTVPTKHNTTKQVYSTRSGLIMTSSCSNRSVVTVYDRNRSVGNSLRAPSGIYLYAAVDEQDRVYVASFDRENDNVVIRLYDLDGLNLKERVEFNVLNLTLNGSWCYLVSLSPDMLAFACDTKLYFIKVSL